MQNNNINRHTGLLATIVVLLGLLGSALVAAQDAGIEIRSASTRLDEGVWYLSADIGYALNRDTLEALQNGISLTFQTQMELTRSRRFLPDETIAELSQDFELSWQPLSRGYLVRNKNSGAQRTHPTLFAALKDLGTLADLPLIDAALISEGEEYEIRLRAMLDRQQLPGPLRMLAFWDDGYALESAWYGLNLRTGERQ